MKRTVLRPLAIGIATLSTVAGMAVGAVSSQAANIGSLTFSPATGIDSNIMTVSTPAACNDATTNYQLTLTGPGFPAAGINVSANSPQSILPVNAAGGYDATLGNTMAFYALQQNPPVTLSGDYTVAFNCRNAFGPASVDAFTGVVTFTQHAGGSPTYTTPVVAVNTTTSLAATPASPVDTATSVAFTAHVAAASGTATPAGTVQFMDGTTAVGSPTAVDASGNATFSTTFATAGSHSVTAVFTGGAGFNNSTSTAVVYTVSQAAATATTTALAISPATADSNTPVTLTATVSPTAAGTVQFSDGGTALGSPVTVSGGVASKTQTFPAGPHSFTAAFTPANSAAFAGSASTSQAITVTAGATNTASETIVTTINTGSLTVSVADTSNVVLPSPQLNSGATYLTTSGRIHPVTVTDTRAGNPGWNLSGQVSDFVNTTGPTTTPIPGVDLGWTPAVIDQNPGGGQTVSAGPVVLPATPPLTVNPTVATAAGLHVSRLLASAAAGAGIGTAHVDALLALNVPTTVVAGTYSATLTLTAI